jgi:sigma-E factor negative regulatory protein RseB
MRMRLLSLAFALLWTSVAPAASSSDEARAWITRMNDALVYRNYDGVLTHKWKGGGETLRLIHRMLDGRMVERVVSTDGSNHEEIRNGNQWFRILPDKRIVVRQTRNRSYGYIATLNGLNAQSEKHYMISSGGIQPLLGWPSPTQYISVEPRDAFRYGYRFWLDPQTAMPVKTQLVTKTGEVMDEISFSSLRLVDSIPDELLKPQVDAKNFRWMSRDVPAKAVTQAFMPRANLLPEGFRVLNFDSPAPQTQGQRPRSQFIVSDGIAWVSVIVAPADKKQEEGAGQWGASAIHVIKLDNHYISVVGEVPPVVVKTIAEAVRPE